ncbi:uncharacterized protein LOC135715038 [Ochlerotatus camptorhynchus]|uniref:uncharacterized protein LOC135715038 n=1 Tax=Ochlerotatus camptorhynchus TaxID=644619 RepID=UPI0031D04EFF
MKLILLSVTCVFASFFTPSESTNDLTVCLSTLITGNVARFAYQVNLFGASPDLLESIQLRNDPRITVNLAPYDQLRDFNHRQLVVWIVDAMQSFANQIEAVRELNVEFRGHFVLVLTTGEFVWKEVLDRFWDMGVTNVVLLVEMEGEEREVVMVGYEPFQEDCCRCVVPKIVDRCKAGAFEEGRFEGLFDNYVRNLHGCSLRIATFTRLPFIEVFSEGERMRLLGVEGELLGTIATRMNFSIEIVVPTDGHSWGRLFPNGSGLGAMGLVIRNEADCTIGGYVPYPRLMELMSASFGYYMTDFVFVVPEELAEVSSLEQFVNPLGTWIWIGMVVVLGTAYVVIVALSCPMVGHFSHHPVLTLYRTTIGDSLPSIPRGNFFRFLLFLLLYYNLVIRESYKGSMISHLTEKRHLNDISTLQAMMAGGYRFVVTESLYNLLFEETFRLDGTVILLNDEEYIRGFEQVIRSRRRIALISIPEEIVDFNRRHPGYLNFRVAGEKIMIFHYSVYFRRSFPMVREFDRLLRRMLAGGLIAKWNSKLLNRRYQVTTLDDEPAMVLTNGHLFSGYIFFAIGLGVATLTFLVEVVSERSAIMRKVLERL